MDVDIENGTKPVVNWASSRYPKAGTQKSKKKCATRIWKTLESQRRIKYIRRTWCVWKWCYFDLHVSLGQSDADHWSSLEVFISAILTTQWDTTVLDPYRWTDSCDVNRVFSEMFFVAIVEQLRNTTYDAIETLFVIYERIDYLDSIFNWIW